jgi:hypothetical protein
MDPLALDTGSRAAGIGKKELLTRILLLVKRGQLRFVKPVVWVYGLLVTFGIEREGFTTPEL